MAKSNKNYKLQSRQHLWFAHHKCSYNAQSRWEHKKTSRNINYTNVITYANKQSMFKASPA